MWVYGHTDLGDYYRGDLSLRQVMVRLLSLPAESPTWDVIREQEEQAQARRQVADIEDVLARFKT